MKIIKFMNNLVGHEHLEGVDGRTLHRTYLMHFAPDILVPVSHGHVQTVLITNSKNAKIKPRRF